MSDWSDRGFPPPDSSSYGYDVDAGLLRTKFGAAKPRQTRAYETGKRTFTITVTFDYVLLTGIENFLYERGFNWFTIDLISGEDTSVTEPIVVRLIEFYTVTNKGKGVYQVSFKVEQKIHRSYYATSVLYPLENFEYSATIAPAPMSTHFWEQVRYIEDWASTSVPTIVSVALDLTVFHADDILPGPFPWDYTNHGWQRNIDLDSVIAVVPVITASLYPFLLNPLNAFDSSSTACPSVASVVFEKTMFHAYIFQDDTLRGDKTITRSPAIVPMTLEQTIFMHVEAGMEIAGAAVPGLTSLSLFQSVWHLYAATADYGGTAAPVLGAFSSSRVTIRGATFESSATSCPTLGALDLFSVNRIRADTDFAMTLPPVLGSMALVKMTHALPLTEDYATAGAPSFGAFSMTNLAGVVRVTVLRTENGAVVPNARVELS